MPKVGNRDHTNHGTLAEFSNAALKLAGINVLGLSKNSKARRFESLLTTPHEVPINETIPFYLELLGPTEDQYGKRVDWNFEVYNSRNRLLHRDKGFGYVFL
jgi:hypothetical protein